MFKIEAIKFLKKIIKVRNYLNNNRLTKNNSYAKAQTIDYIKKQLDGRNWNDSSMSRFLIKHRNEIISLIPGKGSPSHNGYLKQFNELLSKAQQL